MTHHPEPVGQQAATCPDTNKNTSPYAAGMQALVDQLNAGGGPIKFYYAGPTGGHQ